MIEDMEAKMRNQLQEVYFGKTRDVVSHLRSTQSLEKERKARDLQRSSWVCGRSNHIRALRYHSIRQAIQMSALRHQCDFAASVCILAMSSLGCRKALRGVRSSSVEAAGPYMSEA